MNTSSTLPRLAHSLRSAVRPVTILLRAVLLLACAAQLRAATPAVGETAPDFTLKTLSGESVKLSGFTSAANIVLVALRGWPGYQCPFCTTQVYEYISHAADFSGKNVQVILVYPGPSEMLQAHAQEFLKDKPLPEPIVFLVDPNYEFANRYALRWKADDETVYPSTFVMDHNRMIRFAHVSHEHGDRTSAAAVLRFLDGSMASAQGERK